MTRTIGVFDSGVGGLSVAKAITKALPNCRVVFKNDSANVPYGTKTKNQLLTLVTPILLKLEAEGCDVIVIACNTVTTTLITQLRQIIKVPLIGMEPMVKPASKVTKTNVIAVCATPTTLSSARYRKLKADYAAGITVLEPDCSDWSYMIENNQVDVSKIKTTVSDVCDYGADVIVLGCTHYHWIESLIKQTVVNRAEVLQPEIPVIDNLKSILLRQPI